MTDINTALDLVAGEIRICEKCALSETRNNAVPGSGNPHARIMFVGEAPGRNEDMRGEPFVGRAGEILNGLLDSVGLGRDEIFITNIVKCRPPKNRNPSPAEIHTCSPFLDRQIAAIRPEIIATLGNFASGYVLQKFGFEARPIGELHGRVFEVNTLTMHLEIVPLYHPAAAIYDPSKTEILKRDFMLLKAKAL